MTSIFREVPSHFYYLVFSSKEDDLSQEYHEPPCKVIKYANETHQSKLPGSLCRFLKGLLNSTHCEYSIRCHHNIDKAETGEVCSKFVGEHYHLTLYLKSFVGAEAFIKETISNHIICPPKGSKIKNSLVRLMRVSYPENCLQSEARLGGNRLLIQGDKLNSLMKSKPTPELGCNLNVVWEFQRSCYTEFDESEDIEKLSYLSRRLAQLEKSKAVFKDSVLDFIELLLRGFGTINASHHNNVLSVDLGFSNAQCQCYECKDSSNSVFDLNQRQTDDNKIDTTLFSFLDENAQFI